jgi:hypothetical protein
MIARILTLGVPEVLVMFLHSFLQSMPPVRWILMVIERTIFWFAEDFYGALDSLYFILF